MSANTHAAFCINLVRDCGADPTGVADCLPAFAAAYALLQKFAASPAFRAFADFTLYIPPGVYKCNGTIGAWNFAGKAANIRITGHRSSSIIEVVDPAAATAFWSIQNVDCVEIDHLCFTGTDHDSSTWDCGGLLAISVRYDAYVHHVDCYNLNAFFYVFNVSSTCVFDDCGFYNVGAGTGAGSADFGVLYGEPVGASNAGPRATLRNLTFLDIGPLNGVPAGFTKVDTNKTQIRFNGTWSDIVVDSCFVDEDCLNTLIVDATTGGAHPAARTGNVQIRGLNCNPPVLVGGVQGITLKNVDKADVWYCRVGSTSGGGPLVPMFGAVGCTSVHLKNFFIDGTLVGPLLQADANTVEMLIEDGNVPIENTSLACSLPMTKTQGELADVLNASNVTVVGQLVKLTAPKTVTTLAVGDAGNVALVRGVALDVTTPAFTPLSLSALMAWYQADDALVAAWVPRGTADPNRTATQAVAANQPTIAASAQMGGKTAVKFPNGAVPIYMVTGVWSVAINQPCQVYVAGYQSNNVSDCYIFDAIGAHRMGALGSATRTNIDAYAGAGPIVAADAAYAGLAHVMCFEFNGAASKVYVDATGAPIVTGNAGADFATGLTLGNFAGTLAGFSGWDVRHIVVVAGILSALDRAALMNFMAQDIGLSPTPIRVARPSQYATMLNDGAAPIALNATLAPSGVLAGRVAAAGATSSHVGIAAAAAAGVADTPVTVWYVPGNMGVL